MARPRDITSRAPATRTVGPSVDVAPALGEPARVADEGDLCRLWAARAFPADALVAADGAAVRVIYPGRRTGTDGPDFRDAILADGSGRVRAGDVEVLYWPFSSSVPHILSFRRTDELNGQHTP
jgi:hypothetical protein